MRFNTTGSGKGDSFRPVDKKQYDENWIKIFGKKCSVCDGDGYLWAEDIDGEDMKFQCRHCKGIGKV